MIKQVLKKYAKIIFLKDVGKIVEKPVPQSTDKIGQPKEKQGDSNKFWRYILFNLRIDKTYKLG